MSIEVDVAMALAECVQTLATSLGMPLSMPNSGFTPPDEKYLEVRHFRNSNLSMNWGDEKTLIGVYQVSIIDPLQEGEIPATVIASQVIDAFHKNINLYSGSARVVVYESPTLLTTVQLANKSAYPVSIPYRCFKA